jgi:hypothetical protein
MADYHPLIARAVAGLDKNTGENRRALYERARTALVAQLRSVQPALEESEITRERLALEEAIRKVEAEAARQAREAARPIFMKTLRPVTPPREEPPRESPVASPPRAQHLPEPPAPPRPQSAPETAAPSAPAAPRPAPVIRRPIQPEPPRSLHDSIASAPPGSDETWPEPHQFTPPEEPPPLPPERHPLADYGQLEPQMEPENLWALPLDNAPEAPAEYEAPRRSVSPLHEADEPIETIPRRSSSRSYGGLIRLGIVLVLIAVIAGLSYWQRATIAGMGGALMSMVYSSVSPQRPATAPARPKITDRIGQQSPQQSSGPPVAQRVVLYEEDPDDAQGKRFTGSVLWRTEVKSVTPGRSPETVVRADIEIPDRKMGVTWSLRRNTDPSLPASHTIEIVFNLPPDSPSGGVSKVPGVLMKQSEQTRGTPLAGVAAEMPPAYFLIGLSSVEGEAARNIQLLKERPWFDIPIIYKNNRRAILAMEKGTPGEAAFAQAFAAWKE